MDQLPRVLTELAILERKGRDELKAAARPPQTPEQRMGLAFQPGDQVWDLVTGQKGEVISGSTAHYVVQPPPGGKG
jgi:hypothetical protein